MSLASSKWWLKVAVGVLSSARGIHGNSYIAELGQCSAGRLTLHESLS